MSPQEDIVEPRPPDSSPDVPAVASNPQEPIVAPSRYVFARFFDRVEGKWVETPLYGVSPKKGNE